MEFVRALNLKTVYSPAKYNLIDKKYFSHDNHIKFICKFSKKGRSFPKSVIYFTYYIAHLANTFQNI